MTPARRLVGGLLLVMATLAGVATSAWAYWTSSGTGTGSATTATLNAPTAVTASTTPGMPSVSVSWTAPTSGVTPQGYTVTRVPQPGGVPAAACGGVTITSTSCTDSAVAAGTYAYTVNAVYASWSTPSTPSPTVTVVLDATAPTVLGVTSPLPDGSYRTGAVIPVTVTFSEPVLVTGTPQLALATGTPSSTSAAYTAGSGSDTLTFTYTVQANNASADLTYVGTGSLTLNGGTIRDAAGNDAILTLPAITAANSLAGSKALVIDTASPTLLSIVRAGSAPLVNSGPLSWIVTFSEPVAGVTSTSFSVAASAGIGGTAPTISAVTPSGAAPSTTWTVTTTVAGTTGANGATLGLNLASATGVSDLAGNGLASAALTGQAYTYDTTPPGTALTLVNGASAGLPFATTGNVNTVGGTCTPGDGNVTIQVTGATTLTTTVGCTPAGASGAWTLTTNWTTVGTRTFSATQTDAAGNIGTDVETITIDRTAPTVLSVSSPLPDGSYGVGAVIPVTVTFSEPVVVTGIPRLNLSTGSPTSTNVDYTGGSGSATLTFTYTVVAGNSSADLNYRNTNSLTANGGASIKDPAGNNANRNLPALNAATSLAGSKNLVLETTAPTVSSVSSTAGDGSYRAGDDIPVTVTFSEAVTVTGTPTLTLVTGLPATTAVAYSGGTGTNVLTFTYTVAAGNSSADLNYQGTTSLALNSGTIRDGAGNNATLTLPATGSASSLGGSRNIIIDTTAPTVTNVTSSAGNGPYGAGQGIPITVVFSETVTVTGTPQLTLATGTPASTAVDYTGGSGTNTLTFTYTVAPGNTSPDLDYATSTSLTLNGGTIRDAATNDATLTLPTPGGPGSLGANKNLAIDGIAPVVTVANVNGTPRTFPFVTNQTVSSVGGACTTGDGTVTVLANGSNVGTATCSAAAWTLTTNWATTATRSVSATQTDGAGNVGTAPAVAVTIDKAPSVVTGVSSTLPDGAYRAGTTIPVTITFDEPVTVIGTPQLALATGSPTATTVNYTGGTGTSTLTFGYAVVSGNTSADLDYQATTSLTLNGGTIRDAVGNNATLTLPAPGSATSLAGSRNLVIDTTPPSVTAVSSATADGAWNAATEIPITVTFDEPVTVNASGGTPTLALATGSPAATIVGYDGGAGTSTLTFRYTVADGNTSADLDYAATTSLALNGGTIRDAAGNDATLTLPAPGDTGSLGANKALVIDTTPPAVSVTGMARLFPVIWRNVRVSGTAEVGAGTVTVYLCHNTGPPCDASSATQVFTDVVVSGTGTWQTGWSSQAGAGTWYAGAVQADAAGNVGSSETFGPYIN